MNALGRFLDNVMANATFRGDTGNQRSLPCIRPRRRIAAGIDEVANLLIAVAHRIRAKKNNALGKNSQLTADFAAEKSPAGMVAKVAPLAAHKALCDRFSISEGKIQSRVKINDPEPSLSLEKAVL